MILIHGGWIMIPLLLTALIGLTLVFERGYMFQCKFKTQKSLIDIILAHIKSHEYAQAKTLCQNTETPTTSVINTYLDHRENPIEEIELSMKNTAEAWMPHLEKRIEIIDTIITAAPLLGLLGTIIGMMQSFSVLSGGSGNDPSAIAGGVGEALIATATGLIIALLCLCAYNYFSAQIKRLIYEMESVASILIEWKMKEIRKKESKVS